MEVESHLKSLLQLQLASDASAVRNLPYCLSILSTDYFLPSSHLAKWTNRINALLHSKDSGARWAGLCLAYKTSLLSQSIMIDCAQMWIGVALLVLSRSEPLPVLKAAVRLLQVIFTAATELTEFHRQVSVPNVVKFTTAIIPVADDHNDVGLKVLCIETLTRLVIIYPTTHRASSSKLSAFSLSYLNGSAKFPTNHKIMEAAAQLYSVLPLAGGKVGAVNLWRKSLDETIAFGWESFSSLRTTFPAQGQSRLPVITSADPQVIVPLGLDRLRCSVVTLCHLLGAVVQRPVQVPIGSLVKFTTALLAASKDEKVDGFFDHFIRSMEVSTVAEIHTLGCELLTGLAERFPFRMEPHTARIFSVLAFQLEQKPTSRERLALLKAVEVLLKNCHPLDAVTLPARLAKSMLPLITKIISASSRTPHDTQEGLSSKSKSAKKRARNFEGDEVFKSTREVVCPTIDDGAALVVSIDALQILFKTPNLSLSMRSVIGRIIIATLITLPRMSPASLSPNPNFSQLLTKKIEEFSLLIASGTTSATSKALPFVLEAALTSSRPNIQNIIEILLHPRVPPLVRSMLHLESLSLARTEESHDEVNILDSLAVEGVNVQEKEVVEEDVAMTDTLSNSPTAGDDGQDSTIQLVSKSDAISLRPQASEPLVSVIHARASNEDLHSHPPSAEVETNGPLSIPVNLQRVNPPPASLQHEDDEDEDDEMPSIDMDSDSDTEDQDQE